MIVYKTTNLITGKFYVGMTALDKPSYLGSGLLLKRAIKKYGKHNFTREILEECDSKEMLCERERYWIEKLKARELGYNLAEGGEGFSIGHEVSAGVRMIASKTHKGKTISDEHKKKCSDFMKNFDGYSDQWIEQQHASGENHPMYGKQHSDETKMKMSEAHLKNPTKYWEGKTMSEETKRKISEANIGKTHTAEYRESVTGTGNPFYGKKHSDATKEKISLSRKNKTPEQKLERYRKFHISRCGFEPTQEQLLIKYNEYKEIN